MFTVRYELYFKHCFILVQPQNAVSNFSAQRDDSFYYMWT